MKRTHVKRSLGGGFLLLVALVALSLQATPDATQPLDPSADQADRIQAGKIPLGIEFRVPPGAQLGPLGIEFQLPPATAYLRPLGFEYQLPPAEAANVLARGDVIGIEFEVEPAKEPAFGDVLRVEFERVAAVENADQVKPNVPAFGDVIGIDFERLAETESSVPVVGGLLGIGWEQLAKADEEATLPALGDVLGIEFDQLAEVGAKPAEFHVRWADGGSQGENLQAPPCPPVCE